MAQCEHMTELAQSLKAQRDAALDDLAAANATIEALQADLAGAAELLLREQALAESRSLALATMREAIQDMIETAPSVTMRGNGVDRVAVGFDQFVALTQIVAQPADDAAALAGAVLEAADAMAEMMALMLGEDDEPDGDGGDVLIRMARARSAYRRARSALRGAGAVEG